MPPASHVDADGSVHMVDVSDKAATIRQATVEGFLKVKPAHLAGLAGLAKGDALTTAQIAGIQAGKRCSEVIPLCHAVPLTDLSVSIRLADGGFAISATAKAFAVTGVEMEAYIAVVVAGATLIDMLKGIDPDLELTGVRLVEKLGGKEPWRRG